MSADLERAREFMHLGRYRESVEWALRHLAHHTDCVQAHNILAFGQSRVGDKEGALESSKRCLEIDPEEAASHYMRAIALWTAGQMKAAGESAQRAVELAPDDADNHSLLAEWFLAQERPQEALAAADRAIRVDPDDVRHRLMKFDALHALGRDKEAAALMASALPMAPDSADAHRRAAPIALRKGRPGHAAEMFLSALRDDPGDEASRRGLLEALRARSWLYRPVLWVRLRLGRMVEKSEWAFVAMIFVALALLVVSHQIENAALRALSWSLILLPKTLSDIMLLLHPIGRHALRAREIIVAVTLVGFLGAALVFAQSHLRQPSEGLANATVGLVVASFGIAGFGFVLAQAGGDEHAKKYIALIVCSAAIVIVVINVFRTV